MKTHPPQKFNVTLPSFSKQKVQAALLQDGAVVLTNLVPNNDDDDNNESWWSEMGAQIPHWIWEPKDLLLPQHRAESVHQEHQRLSLQGEALHPHSDGYIWGDQFPDVVILFCQEPAAADAAGDGEGEEEEEECPPGANYLIDGYHVVARLDDATQKFLEDTLVDHTERSDTAYVNGTESIVPVIRWLSPKGWRQNDDDHHDHHGGELDDDDAAAGHQLCWRRMIAKEFAGKQVVDKETGEVQYGSLWAPVAECENKHAVNQALLELDQAIAAEERQSRRFVLAKGEALIVDNFRMLHSREAFHGLHHKRRMWRIWSWTNASFGLPPQVVALNETPDANLPANILDAEKSIQAKA